MAIFAVIIQIKKACKSSLFESSCGYGIIPAPFRAVQINQNPGCMGIKHVIIKDKKHSKKEERFFCIGNDGDGILTVRFTMRNGNIRIFGAGYWREGRDIYEQKKNYLH